LTDYFFDIIVLEHTDTCDAGSSGVETGAGILKCDAAQGEDWELSLTGALENLKA